MTVPKGPIDRNITPLIVIVRYFKSLFFALYQLSIYLFETIEDAEQNKSTLSENVAGVLVNK
jgi:hypothetical protein